MPSNDLTASDCNRAPTTGGAISVGKCYDWAVMGKAIFTIGHSNHEWEAFAALLATHGIVLLVDTRTSPVSRYAPWANARTLKAMLGRARVEYAFMGDSLGGKPSDGSCYRADGRPDYREIRTRPFFRDGIDALLEIAEGRTIALMCAEEDPSKCHRRLLIEPALLDRGVEVRHIRGDGTVATPTTLSSKKAYREQLQGMFPMDG